MYGNGNICQAPNPIFNYSFFSLSFSLLAVQNVYSLIKVMALPGFWSCRHVMANLIIVQAAISGWVFGRTF